LSPDKRQPSGWPIPTPDEGRIRGGGLAGKGIGGACADLGGAALAHQAGEFALIDEYRLYVHPVILGQGRPFFDGPLPPLRLRSSETMDGDVIRLTYVRA